MYDRKTREELDALSLEVFGSKSRWRKIVEAGVPELIEEDTTRLKADGSKEIVKTALMYVGPNGGELPQYKINRYTAETIKEKMLSIKNRNEELKQMIKMQQENQKAAEELKEAKKAVEKASGTSV